jgi:putative tryptophan/tyrosine transport system substrate-binding protein
MIRRREFITLLGGAAVGWPVVAGAQQTPMPVIGFLHPNSPETSVAQVAAFRKGLSEVGYSEGQNVAIEYRWARNDNTLPLLATDLVSRQVTVIVPLFSTAATLAAKAATATIPIVFYAGSDPVKSGLVRSLNRPGANVTGVTSMAEELTAKRLGLLHELVPGANRFAVLINPHTAAVSEPFVNEVQAAVKAIGREVELFSISSSRDLDAAFASFAQNGADGFLYSPDPIFYSRRLQMIMLAVRYGTPGIYTSRDYAEAGGLMSYGPDNADHIRQTAVLAARILKGEKASDLPVLRSSRFEFVVNLQTAKMIGVDVPPSLLARADEVIE